ncbi:Rossmann-like and DUF2520 domain-containing protein [Cesiribacter sp. SM1]|uniref:Rossmann-like and DUF2520 domain-containing protein n=1 Tax=Cesiribacter sp. SM1 TaxID=2861196 RepID=UPI001CD20AB2|nr:Rossmann-like and DUF2520 domain-containing protein [Cesiribacter sp. SM1]
MAETFNISIVGAGRVGWHLAQALSAVGHTIQEIWSRRQSQAHLLAAKLPNARVVHSLDFSESPSQVFLLTVTDAALADIGHRLRLPKDAVVAHSSGSQALNMLNTIAAGGTGVFYPLQTFSKEKEVNMAEVPFFIEGSNPATTLILEALALSLSNKVHRASGEQRRQLHLAAVFASNFSNHMLRIAHDLLQESRLPTDLLHPLIEETLQKAIKIGPAPAQTGPAVRGDIPILEQHQKQLLAHPEWMQLYKLISDDILEKSKINKQ